MIHIPKADTNPIIIPIGQSDAEMLIPSAQNPAESKGKIPPKAVSPTTTAPAAATKEKRTDESILFFSTKY
jgi:hypothetical protein